MLLVVLLKLRKKYEEMGSLDKTDEYLREAKCVAENLNLDDVSTIVELLKEADKDLSKQVPPLVKLGEWYLDKAKTTNNANDFTKADARKEIVFGLGKRQKIQFFELSRLPQRVPNFSKL